MTMKDELHEERQALINAMAAYARAKFYEETVEETSAQYEKMLSAAKAATKEAQERLDDAERAYSTKITAIIARRGI